MVFSKLSFSQEFSSSEKLSDNLSKVEVVFKEIKSVEVMFQIISTLKELDGVSDVELFYPDRRNGYLLVSPKVSAKAIVEKLASINVELDLKSFKN